IKLRLPLSRRARLCRLLAQHLLHACEGLVQKTPSDIRRSGRLRNEQTLGRFDPFDSRLGECPAAARFAPDSPLEEAVSCELVSKSRFPVTRENTANYVRLRGAAPVDL